MSEEEAIMEPKEEEEEEDEQEGHEEGEKVSKSPHPKAPLPLIRKKLLWKAKAVE